VVRDWIVDTEEHSSLGACGELESLLDTTGTKASVHFWTTLAGVPDTEPLDQVLTRETQQAGYNLTWKPLGLGMVQGPWRRPGTTDAMYRAEPTPQSNDPEKSEFNLSLSLCHRTDNTLGGGEGNVGLCCLSSSFLVALG
jgi:hypothetical protein